ncbi:hypothetical protein KJ713_02390 [Patescibacteria group bacterium]|nr:hypothetical protein [Patescibacteria group bacterium]
MINLTKTPGQDNLSTNGVQNESPIPKPAGVRVVGIILIILNVVGFLLLKGALVDVFIMGINFNFYFQIGTILSVIQIILLIISGVGLVLYRRWGMFLLLAAIIIQLLFVPLAFAKPDQNDLIGSLVSNFIEFALYFVFLLYIFFKKRFLK